MNDYLAQLEYQQMLAREQAVVERLKQMGFDDDFNLIKDNKKRSKVIDISTRRKKVKES